MARRFSITKPIRQRRYSFRWEFSETLHPSDGESEGDNLTYDDLIPTVEDDVETALEVAALGVGEVVFVGGGASPSISVFRTR